MSSNGREYQLTSGDIGSLRVSLHSRWTSYRSIRAQCRLCIAGQPASDCDTCLFCRRCRALQSDSAFLEILVGF